MAASIIEGNIFTSKAQTIVNTVNCVGVMGAGIALECRLRYPVMYQRYVELCESGQIDVGSLWLYKSDRWILNFPTKKHWKNPSKIEYLESGLDKFVRTYHKKAIKSIAFPLLGADKGGIDPNESLRLMLDYLDEVDIEVEIYKYDPRAKDDLFESTKKWLLSKSIPEVSSLTGIRPQYIEKVFEAVKRSDIMQLNQLGRVKGIGIKTMERIFRASKSPNSPETTASPGDQGSLPL